MRSGTDADSIKIRKLIGFVSDNVGLYDALTAYENLDYYGKLYKCPEPRRKENIERFLKLLGLWEKKDAAAGTFSKGMKQKLAIARALIHDPEILFMDEPTANLDPESAKTVREFILDLKKQKKTIFLNTHNLDEAQRVCDKIGVLNTRLMALGTPAGARVLRRREEDRDTAGRGERRDPGRTQQSVSWEGDSRWLQADPRACEPQQGESCHRACYRRGGSQRPVRLYHGFEPGRRLSQTREGAAGMNLATSLTVAAKELKVIRRKKSIISYILVFPFLLSVLFLLIVQNQVVSSSEYSLGLESLTYFFVVLAAVLPASIAAYSIVGEKVEKSLEPLLATPTTDGEILLGKSIAAFLLPVLTIWAAATFFMAATDYLTYGALSFYYFPNWTSGVMLFLLAPLAAIFSIETAVIASSRVSDVRGANQIASLMFLPFMGVFLAGVEGVFTFNADNLLVVSGIVLIIDVALLFLSTATFRREEILTKWR